MLGAVLSEGRVGTPVGGKRPEPPKPSRSRMAAHCPCSPASDEDGVGRRSPGPSVSGRRHRVPKRGPVGPPAEGRRPPGPPRGQLRRKAACCRRSESPWSAAWVWAAAEFQGARRRVSLWLRSDAGGEASRAAPGARGRPARSRAPLPRSAVALATGAAEGVGARGPGSGSGGRGRPGAWGGASGRGRGARGGRRGAEESADSAGARTSSVGPGPARAASGRRRVGAGRARGQGAPVSPEWPAAGVAGCSGGAAGARPGGQTAWTRPCRGERAERTEESRRRLPGAAQPLHRPRLRPIGLREGRLFLSPYHPLWALRDACEAPGKRRAAKRPEAPESVRSGQPSRRPRAGLRTAGAAGPGAGPQGEARRLRGRGGQALAPAFWSRGWGSLRERRSGQGLSGPPALAQV